MRGGERQERERGRHLQGWSRSGRDWAALGHLATVSTGGGVTLLATVRVPRRWGHLWPSREWPVTPLTRGESSVPASWARLLLPGGSQ